MDGFPVEVGFPVHWGEMDAFGHVNNIRYFAWFESARIELFIRVGLTSTAPTGVGPILATTTCDFLVPVVFPATVRVGTRVASIGNTSFKLDYQVVKTGSPDVVVARGSSVVVLVDYGTGAKKPVEGDLRARLQALS